MRTAHIRKTLWVSLNHNKTEDAENPKRVGNKLKLN
jgi:hypothetical protein